jgi:hypothetical protein
MSKTPRIRTTCAFRRLTNRLADKCSTQGGDDLIEAVSRRSATACRLLTSFVTSFGRERVRRAIRAHKSDHRCIEAIATSWLHLLNDLGHRITELALAKGFRRLQITSGR